MRPLCRYLSALVLPLCTFAAASAQNLKQISHNDGLTNNAVFTLFQDKDGYIWIGSCDGLSLYYGQRVHPVTFPDGSSLGGYLVEQILTSDGDRLWARTEHGLKSWTRSSGILRDFPQFKGAYSVKTSDNGTVLVHDGLEFHYYDPEEGVFVPFFTEEDADDESMDFGCTGDFFWRITRKGVFRYSWARRGNASEPLSEATCLLQGEVVSSVSTDGNIYLTEAGGSFSHFDIVSGRKALLLDLADQLPKRGNPSAVVEMKDDLFISFSTKGVLRYRRGTSGNYRAEDIGLKVGTFDMVKDRRQEVVWIATDGQGIYQYWEAPYSVRSVEGRDVSPEFGSPVRALHIDGSGCLWVGTKGSGILVRGSGDGTGSPGLQHWLTTSESGLSSNLVYVFAKSGLGGFWIGTEEGLDFYEESARKVVRVLGAGRIRYVHAVEEVGDSLLWIATVGEGIYQASVSRTPAGPRLSGIRHYSLDRGKLSSNFFFSMCRSADGSLWLGNRGTGVYRLSSRGLEPLPLSSTSRSQTVADVFSLVETDGILWVGTGRGLVRVEPSGTERYFDTGAGLPNNTVHSLLTDGEGGIWISTNEGLARLDPASEAFERYDRNKGLTVEEFSDGAALRADDGTLYFGGVNGWVEVRRNRAYVPASGFIPDIAFTAVAVKGKQLDIFKRLGSSSKDGARIGLRHDENSFTAEWVVFDNINYEDYSYQYRVGTAKNGEWIDNGRSNILSFTSLAPGDYFLAVKARNLLTGEETGIARLEVNIGAPWYASGVAKGIYVLLILGAAIGLIYTLQYRAGKRQEYALEQMDRRHKEELYEEKLHFFTNVTHEFKTPLTLIYTPCERILSYDGADDYVKKYTKVIRANTDRLNALIQEIIDYRKLESGHQAVHLKEVNVSDITMNHFHSFLDVAEQNGMAMEQEVGQGLRWTTDSKCWGRILTNLVTNALKYTKQGGIIRISLEITQDDFLQLKVYNTGKGIAAADKERIFNRYGILENVEENRVGGITSRNGLGLSICKGLVELLGGTIGVESVVGEYAEFIVRLPRKEVQLGDAQPEEGKVPEVPKIALDAIKSELAAASGYVLGRKGLPMVLVVDDNQEIQDLLRDSLSQFDVRTASDAEGALRIIKEQRPDVVITDIMMPGTDGFALTRQIKENRHTMNIPLVILSARSSEEDHVRALEVGADAYIEKPFSINYMKALIDQMLKSAGRSREYYGSSASAFQYAEGRLLSNEDKELLQGIDSFLDEHLGDGNISVDILADAVRLSPRALYRRFNSMHLPPPNEFIKERKMKHAAKMLLTSNLTIQEVIYECGFANRAHFYKEFGRRFGMTPKEFRAHNRMKDDSLS